MDSKNRKQRNDSDSSKETYSMELATEEDDDSEEEYQLVSAIDTALNNN